MKARSLAVSLSALALASLVQAPGARAEDEGPVTGVPEDSIAKNWNDPLRASFARRGITYGLNYTGEVFNVPSGGFSRGSSYNGLIETVFDIDFEKLAGWKGLTFHTNVYYIHGLGPTGEHIGALFPVSNLEALESYRLDEIWFEQALLDDKLKLRVGSLAADTEFFLSDSAGQFINGTFGWAGILALNQTQGGPAYPLASLGARLQYTPNDKLTILAGIFNGSPADPLADDAQKDNRHGTEFRLSEAPLLMYEGQFKYNVGELGGVVKLGGWKQLNSDFTDFRTGTEGIHGNHGLYAIVDQQIWKQGDDKSISIFGRVVGSPEYKNAMDFYYDTGIVFLGIVPGRIKDSFGAAFGYGHISDDFALINATGVNGDIFPTYESVLEVNYKAVICDGFTITPEFQYFWNPGGRVAISDDSSEVIDHAAVFGARTQIHY